MNMLRKSGLLVIAVLLLAAMAFAGVASADHVAPEQNTSAIDVKGYGGSTYLPAKSVLDAFLIRNESNWRYVVDYPDSYKTAILVLTDDITFSSDVKSLATFSGTIYGNGYRFMNFTQSGNNAHGLIGTAGDGCELNYVRMVDSNIDSSTSNVGGLVGKVQSSATVKLYGCGVESSTIKATYGYVGGLIGEVSDGVLEINSSFINRAYVQSTSLSLGGLVGQIKKGNIADSWVNGSEIYAGGSNVGGLIGFGDFSLGTNIRNASVKNSKIWGKDQHIGGLLGQGKGNAGLFSDCHVEYATVISTENVNVGGLFGFTASPVTMSGSTEVKWTWVNGLYPVNIGPLYGSGSTSGTAPTHTSVWSSSRPSSTALTDNDFDNISTAEYAFKAAGIGSAIDRNDYAVGKDYGYMLYPVTVSTDGHGTAAAEKPGYYKYGSEVRLNSSPAIGYHFDEWNSPDVTISANKFTMPAKAVTVTAKFAGNETTVSFYNGTAVTSLSNVFGTAVNKPSPDPVKPGYTFAGWNVTEDGGLTWKSFTLYLAGGLWNHTGPDGGTLAAYANWTLTPLYINNVTTHGVVLLSQNIATVGDSIHLEAIPNTGYHFESWNVTDSAGNNITVDVSGNFVMQSHNVEASALFLGNVTDVIFENGSGNSSHSNIVGHSLQKPENPKKSGYTFAGWNVTFDGGATWKSLDSYVAGGKWNYDGAHGGTLTAYAAWSAYASSAAPASGSNSQPSSDNSKYEGTTQFLTGNAYADTVVQPAGEPVSSSPSDSLPAPTSQFVKKPDSPDDGGFPFWIIWIIIGGLALLSLIIFFIIYRRRGRNEYYRNYRRLLRRSSRRRRSRGWL